MPLFEYVCGQCGERHELLVRASDKPTCPACGSKKMEKQASHFAPVNASAPSGGGGPACEGCSSAGGCPMRG